MADGDNYGDLQQPTGGYAPAGGADASSNYSDVQNPPSPYKQKAGAATNAIDLVKADLKGLNVSLQGASLIDMTSHRNHVEFEKIGFLAWTNSGQAIYINVKGFDPNNNPEDWRAQAVIGIRHELVHVLQFKSNGGPPKTFKTMISFEAQAYSDTVKFIDDPKTQSYLLKTVGTTQQVLDDTRKEMVDEGAVCAAEEKVKASEVDYKKWLTDPTNHGGFLPADLQGNKNYTIGDLYKP